MNRIYFVLLSFLLSFVFTACLKEYENPAIGIPNPIASVEILRAAYKGADVTIAPDKIQEANMIAGVVVSDAASKNAVPGSVVVQSFGRGNIRGITLSLSEAEAAAYAVGDSVMIDVVGATLTRKKGVLLLTGLSAAKITKVAEKIPAAVKQITLSELAANFPKYEGVLVQVNADVKPVPVNGETYAGDRLLFDGTEADVTLHTEPGASFATRRVPASASFTGIATLNNSNGDDTAGAKKQIWMRNISDVKDASGPLYANFPEDFETPDFSVKSSYNMANNNLDLKTGNWLLYQAILGNTSGRDRFNPSGKQCIRMQQNLSESGYVQMNFDLPNGATKVTVAYGAYYTDAKSTWRLEYSQDGGATWQQIGQDISDAPAGSKTATFLMDIQGKVRFRINKRGLGTTNGTTILNGRLSIEDIAIFQN